MPVRECSRCKVKFTRKSTYDYHVNRKNKCKIMKDLQNYPKSSENLVQSSKSDENSAKNNGKIDREIVNTSPKVIVTPKNPPQKNMDNNSFICNHCKKIFANKWNLNRHSRNQTCYDEDDLSMMEILKKEFEEFKTSVKKEKEIDNKEKESLKNQIKRLEKEVRENKTNKTTNNIYMDNSNNINNNIILVGYGKENMDKIDTNKILECMRKGFHSTIQLTDTVHFNPDHPEYHNIYISNLKNKYAMVYKDGSWQTVIEDDLIDQLYDNKRNYIEDNMEKFYERLTKSQKNALHRWLNVDDNDQRIKNIKNDIRLLLFNKKNLPIQYRS